MFVWNRSHMSAVVHTVVVRIFIALVIMAYIIAWFTAQSKVDDNSTVLAQYNKFVCNDYITPASYAEDDHDLARIVSPNICK